MGCRSIAIHFFGNAGTRDATTQFDPRQIRGIQVIVAGDANQSEQRIASRVGKCRPHLMRGHGVADRADRPIGGDPFPRRMRKHGGQPNESAVVVYRRGLHGRNLLRPGIQAHEGGVAGIVVVVA